MVSDATVTIPLEEYIELRRRADENFYLANKLGEMDIRMLEFRDKLFALEMRLEKDGKKETAD